MSYNLGSVYEDDEDYSPARGNAKGILRATGTVIVATAVTKQLGLVIPTDTSAGLVKNVPYAVDYDSSFNRIQFVPVFHWHQHDSDDDEAGGRFIYLRQASANSCGVIENYNAYNLSDWITNASFGASGTLSTDNSEVSTVFNTGTTTLSHAHGTIGGMPFEFGDIASWQWAGKCSHNANILVRAGINVDTVTQTPDTTIRKFGMEGCDGHGVNWVMINGNGNSGSEHVTATTSVLNPSGSEQYAILHDPGSTDAFYSDRTLNATSSTNVASDGTTSESRTLRYGIKLPTGTTAKLLHVKCYQLIGNTSDHFFDVYI